MMTNLDNVKNRLIDRILVTHNLDFLVAVENLFSSAQKEDIYNLSSEQVELLMMSEQDISEGRLIDEDVLNK